ncbi:MAG TPA: DUF4118 domain-containing protein, partial [Streptosporangiaceae bacterium]|nr:DUF4118 domain-containing protein [Streptosporangiaceae bacterium]
MSALGGLAGAWLWRRSPARRVAAWVLAVVGPALVTLALTPFRLSLSLGGFLFCMLLVVIAVAVIGGARPALTGVVLGVLWGEFFYAFPHGNPGVMLGLDLVSLIAFAIAGPAAGILIAQLAQLAQEQASSRRVEAALRRVATLVARGVPPAEIFSAVAGEARRLFDACDAAVFRFEPDGGAILVAGQGPGLAKTPAGARREPDDISVTTAVWRTGRSVRMDEDAWSTASGPFADLVRTLGLSSVVASPIIVQGRRWGALVVSVTRKAPPPDTEKRLASFTELVATAVSNAENLAELTASRARIVATADETRRKIERDLHDGAQQRLVSLSLALRAAQTAVPPQLGELGDELAHVAEGLVSVLDDLREMARGIHPA